jgi:hypothetical protein
MADHTMTERQSVRMSGGFRGDGFPPWMSDSMVRRLAQADLDEQRAERERAQIIHRMDGDTPGCRPTRRRTHAARPTRLTSRPGGGRWDPSLGRAARHRYQ